MPGDSRTPTQNPADIDDGFPLRRPDWDFNSPEDKEHLKVYRQALLAGLKGAMRRPTNSTKVREIRQNPTESPGFF